MGGFNLPKTPTEAITKSIQNPIAPGVGAVVPNLVKYGLVAGAGAVGGLLLGGGGQDQKQQAAADLQTEQHQDLAQRMQQEILSKISAATRQGADTSGSVTIGGSAGGARILSPTTTSSSSTETTTSTTTTTYNIQAPRTYSIQLAAQDQQQEQKQDMSGILIAAAVAIGAVILFRK